MAEPVTVADLKVQLRLGAGASAEDGFLADQIVAARRAIENLTNQDIVGAEPTLPAADIPVARQAIMLLAAYWYDNRDVTGAMPAAVEALARPLRRWCD